MSSDERCVQDCYFVASLVAINVTASEFKPSHMILAYDVDAGVYCVRPLSIIRDLPMKPYMILMPSLTLGFGWMDSGCW